MSKNNSRLRKYLKLVTIIVVPFFCIWLIVVAGYLIKDSSEDQNPLDETQTSIIDKTQTDLTPDSNIDEQPIEVKNELIVSAILGLDESGALTDVMMVGVYNTSTNMIDIFSIPRDTLVRLSDSAAESLQTSKNTRLNHVHSHAMYCGIDEPEQYTLQILEEILGLEIDHYAKISLDVFKEMVDAIGGVELTVPELMDYYDPAQDLYIYLEPGQQVLDGEKAEGFVRYRSTYVNGDLGRIEMQQYFMQAFLKSALEPEIIKQIPSIVTTLYSNVTTNIGVWDILSYSKYINDINTSSLRSYTIPGTTKDGEPYYFIDIDDVQAFVKEKLSIVPPEVVDSKGLSIEVLNGGTTNGLAGKFENKLNEEGFNVTSVSNYEGSRIDKTRIYVSDEKYGQDLVPYFVDAQVIVDASVLTDNIDIQIVVGGSEK